MTRIRRIIAVITEKDPRQSASSVSSAFYSEDLRCKQKWVVVALLVSADKAPSRNPTRGYLQTSSLAERGGRSLISKLPSRRPRSSPLQKSVTRLGRGNGIEIVCGWSSQLNTQTIRAPGRLMRPTLDESSANSAACPVGGSSFLSIARRSGAILVRSSPESSIPPLA